MQKTHSTNSIDFFMRKAVEKEGLEVSGMRMIYLDKDQSQMYEQLFKEKVENEKRALFAMVLRGVDAA